MVIGGVAGIIYSEPRYTQALDLLAQLDPAQASALSAAFPAAEFYVPPIEVIEAEARRPSHGHFEKTVCRFSERYPARRRAASARA